MSEKTPLWRDARFRRNALQVIVLFLLVIAVAFFANNLVTNFKQLGLKFGFDFIDRPASFGIGDTAIAYQPTDPYTRALFVGLLNSLRVIIVGIIIASVVGITVGISRLADNWLVRQLATVYVEVFRNTPLLLQLFFWYFAVFLRLPKIESPLTLPGSIYLTNAGLNLPWPANNTQTLLSIGFLIISALLAVIIWKRRTYLRVVQGDAGKALSWGLLAIAFLAFIALIFGLDWQFPVYDPAIPNIQGGLTLSSEFGTILIGLSCYTAAFIAEVVRAGIQSVSKGQGEAAKALGLNPNLSMRLVIFPQALRVMIPPLTSEFLNLAKNSSLGVAIGYFDFYAVSSTVSNQTGRGVEMLLILMITYLSINAIIALGMNYLNRSVQIKER